MDWSQYRYLLVVAAGALGLLAYDMRSLPALLAPGGRRTRLELVVLGTACALGLLAIYWHFLTGERMFSYLDMGADTHDQYVPFYVWLVRAVKEGDLGFWTFDFGLGEPIAAVQDWAYDPANLLLVPLVLAMGLSRLSIALAVVQCAKVALAAFLFDHLATFHCRQPLSRVVASLLFAFSNAIILRGQHYFLGTSLPLLALITLALELYLERRTPGRFLAATLSVAVLSGWSAYIAFMVLAFDVAYVALRIVHQGASESAREGMVRFGHMAVPVVCGLLLSGALMVPYAYFLLGESGRVSAGDSAPLLDRLASAASFVPLSWLGPMASRMLGGGLVETGISGYYQVAPPAGTADAVDLYEFIELGYSVGAFVLLGQFASWLVRDARGRERLAWVVASVLVLLYCLNLFIPTALNAFVKPSYRSCYLLAVPLCLAMGRGWEERVATRRIDPPALAASVGITALALAWSLRHAVTGRPAALVFCACLVALVAALLVANGSRGGRLRDVAVLLAVAALFGSQVVDGFFLTNKRTTDDRGTFPCASMAAGDTDTGRALAWIEAQDNSFFRVDETYATWGAMNDSLVGGYASVTAYNSTPDYDVDAFYHQLWPRAFSPTLVYTQGFKWDANQPQLASLLGLRYVLSLSPIDLPWLEEVHRTGTVIIYQNTLYEGLATARTGLVAESTADALPSADERRALLDTAIIAPDEACETPKQGATGDSQPTCSSSFRQEGPDVLVGTIDVSADCYACLPIPNTATWTVEVDGTPVDAFRANYGFLGFQLSAGKHQVRASYVPGGFKVGCVLSAIGAAGTIASMPLLRRRERA